MKNTWTKTSEKTQDETPEIERSNIFLTLQPLQSLIPLLQAETAEVVTSLAVIQEFGLGGLQDD